MQAKGVLSEILFMIHANVFFKGSNFQQLKSAQEETLLKCIH